MKKRVIAVLTVFVILVSLLAIPASAAETSMYSYNGVELPDINTVWTDKETYLYAIIVQYVSTSKYYLLLLKENGISYSSGAISINRGENPGAEQYVLNDGVWAYHSYFETASSFLVSGSYKYYHIWTYSDVLREDGTVYFAASDPVPVYSGTVESITIGGFPDSCQTGLYIGGYATVSGTGDFDPTYTMSLSGGTSSDTKLSSSDGVNYTLDVGRDETAETLTVTAISTADPSVTDMHVVTVTQVSTITDIVISPASVDALPGDIVQFTASVTGTGDYNTGVLWSLSDNAVDGGVTVDDGLVTIPDTFEGLIAVEATALGDSDVYDISAIVVQSSSDDSDSTTDDGTTDGSTSGNCASCQSIFDYLITPFVFRSFDFTTGTLSETTEPHPGFISAFYRFMQNMEQYVGTLVYSTSPDPIESEIKSNSYELYDVLTDTSEESGGDVSVGAGDISSLKGVTSDLGEFMKSDYSISDFFGVLNDEEQYAWFSEETASQLDTTVTAVTFGLDEETDYEKYGMDTYYDHIAQVFPGKGE